MRLPYCFKLISIASAIALAGCSSDSDDSSTDTTYTAYSSVRVVHASPDAPAVNVTLNTAQAVTNLDYGQSTGFVEVESGSYDIDVNGILPASEVNVIDVDGFMLGEGDRTTIVAVGNVADIAPLVLTPSTATAMLGQITLQVLHAAPDAPAVDIYLTAPGADLATSTPAFNFAFSDSIDVGAVTAGEVQIRAVYEGAVVFDSGTVDLAPLAGKDILIAAIAAANSIEADASPIKLLAMTGDSQIMINDIDLGAGARVVHASPDAALAAGGAVEVFATSQVLGDDPVELIGAFNYLDVFPATGYAMIPAGTYAFDVGPDIDSIGGSVFTSGDLGLEAGVAYSVIAAGRLTNDPAFTLLATADSARSIATQASVKIIHAAPAAGDVDIYVTGAGDYSAEAIETGMGGDPLLSGFSFGTITDYVAVTPGRYDIRVVAGGVTAINVEDFELGAGLVANIIARGPSESNGTAEGFSVIVTTN